MPSSLIQYFPSNSLIFNNLLYTINHIEKSIYKFLLLQFCFCFMDSISNCFLIHISFWIRNLILYIFYDKMKWKISVSKSHLPSYCWHWWSMFRMCVSESLKKSKIFFLSDFAWIRREILSSIKSSFFFFF